MSEYERRLERKQAEQGSTTRRHPHRLDAPRSDLPGRSESSGLSRLPALIRQAGNATISWLLGRKSGGKPLPPTTLMAMERAFGADFSQVRTHDDAGAHTVTDALNAEAVTHGDDVFLDADAPAPESPAGNKLLAHELAHVAQQRRAGGQRTGAVNQPSDRFESDADRAAAAATSGQPAQVAARGAPPAVQRQERQAGFVEQQLRNLLDRALQEGISYDSEKGLKVGGVAVSDVERGVEVFDRILDGDFQGALQVINPRDPREEERRREEFRRLREELERFRDQLRPPEEKKREQREMERRRSEALRQMAERLGIKGRTRFRLREPTLDLRTVGLHPGTTTHWIFDRFRLESAALQPHHRQRLNDLANQVKSNPNAELEIVGHADTSGPLAFNQGLSERRARAVRDYLVGRGVQADKIKSVTGRGEEEPRIPERTETDRALNRRVEVFFWTGVSQRRKSPFGIPPLRLRD